MAGTVLKNGLPVNKTGKRVTVSVEALNHARANNQILLSGSGGQWPESTDSGMINKSIFFLEGFHPASGATIAIKSIDGTSVFSYTGTNPVDYQINPIRFEGGIVYTGNCEYLKGFFVNADQYDLQIV